MKALVSFLMPVAAPAPFLEEALAAVVDQRFQSWELVLVLDGFDQGVLDIARRSIPPNQLRLVSLHERRGIAHALNQGLQAAVGDLVARIDADDLCHTDRLVIQVEQMEKRARLALLGSAARLIRADGLTAGTRRVPTGQSVLDRLLVCNQFIHSAVVFRRDVVLALGGYDEACHLREDYELWLRVARHHDVDNLAAELVDYRISDGQISRGQPSREAMRKVWSGQRALAESLGMGRTRALARRAAWQAAQQPWSSRVKELIGR